MTNRPASHYPDIGVLGEEFVAQWLHSQGWIVLHRRWRCPWGELDLIAKLDLSNEMTGKQAGRGNNSTYDLRLTTYDFSTPLLAFVEVKTRSRGSWDAGGLLAITPQKQAKLWQAAQCFLATFSDFADYSCRFDVALVRYQKLSKNQSTLSLPKPPTYKETALERSLLPVQLGQAIEFAGYQLVLQEYLPSAFD
jgi:putative endonuclease